MIGIYEDSFLKMLEDNLGVKPKVTSKNIIIPCLWCELNLNKKHYHLYISLDSPIFHCFAADCQKSGTISKLLNKLTGIDSSDKYIDKEKIKTVQKNDIKLKTPEKKQELIIPELKEDKFKLKSLFLKGRLKYSMHNLSNIKGLIFDINEFIEINNIKLDSSFLKIKDYINTNFVGFLTHLQSLVMFRNIDQNSNFKFFKLYLSQTKFLDYYRLPGNNSKSNNVVLAEGIFDIYNEQIFDYTKMRNDTKLYASGLSTSYDSLIKSIVFNEKIYRLDVTILSDRGISLDYYKKIKKRNLHVINKMSVYYNKHAKDFGENNISPEKFIL